MDFTGHLFYKGNGTSESNAFPMKYIQFDTYNTIPNSREEIKAKRDDNTRNLTRVTASGTKSSFSFKTIDNLHLADKKAIQNWFVSGESDTHQRKITLTYWNDEDNDYKTGDFYRADIKFNIKTVRGTDIIYQAAEISMVEY